MTEPTPFWFDSPGVLFDPSKAVSFVPSGSQTLAEKMNSLVRFGMYFAVIQYVLQKSETGVYMLMLILLITFFLGTPGNIEKFQLQDYFSPDNKPVSQDPDPAHFPSAFGEGICTKSTQNNPFGNFDMINDFTDNPERAAACSLADPDTRDLVNKNFETGLFKDVDDLFDKNNSQGRFYTMPVTEIMNDQTGFAKQLYLTPDGSCKENQLNCAGMYPLSDLRYNRSILIDPNRNPLGN